MKNNTKTLADFFLQNPHYFQLAIQGYPGHYPSNPEIWEAIFLYVFEEKPTDCGSINVAYSTPRPGSTDIRWCTLLSKNGYGYMNAMNDIITTHLCVKQKGGA